MASLGAGSSMRVQIAQRQRGTQRLPIRPTLAPPVAARAVAAPRGAPRGSPLRAAAAAAAAAAATSDTEKLGHPLSFYDRVKESHRRFCRTVYDFDAWEGHRSSERHLNHFVGVFSSRTVFGLLRPLAYVVALATAVVAFETLRTAGALPACVPSLQLNFSGQLFGLTSFALSLLLVFRTNASYERWDGARKTWGAVLNRSRDLVRQGLSYFPPESLELKAMLCRWVMAFSRTLMCHLRKGSDVRAELRGVLLPHEVEQVVLAQHRPNYVLQVITEVVKSARARTAATIKMDDNLTSFEDGLGSCERILRTPIPLSYTRHTSRFLMIWLTMLPFTLFSTCGVVTIPLTAVIAFLLLGIEEIGVSIEEPFSILPLEAICNTVAANIRELQAAHAAATAAGGEGASGAALMQLSAGQLVAQALLSGDGEGVHANGGGAPAGNGAGVLVGAKGGGPSWPSGSYAQAAGSVPTSAR